MAETTLSLLFWNVSNRDLRVPIRALIAETDADIVALAECPNREDVLADLREFVDPSFHIPHASPNCRIACFCRHSALGAAEVRSSTDLRLSIRNCRLGSQRFLLALLHGLDPRNSDEHARQSYAQDVAIDLRATAETYNMKSVIVLGDFNMNPFDRGMDLARGFNAMMTRECVSNGQRTSKSKLFDFYYNPMWSCFGDNNDGPSGTIYDTSDVGPYGWSMFDQVLIHHSLVANFESVSILSEAGGASLATRLGHPDKANMSDHFPIAVKLRGETNE